MRVTVHDANILIDLDLAGILGTWLEWGHETHITDLIALEIRRGRHPLVIANIHSGRITVHPTSTERLAESMALAETVPQMGFKDVGCCLLAEELGALLLTGDGPIRQFAKARPVELHGTLWIFDRLVEHRLLKPADAADKLESLLAQDRYLPRKACEERIRKWRGA